MNNYKLRSLGPREMDAKETAKPEERYKQKDRPYIEATLNPSGRSFKVVIGDRVLERVVVS